MVGEKKKKTFYVDEPKPEGNKLAILSFGKERVVINNGILEGDKVIISKKPMPFKFETLYNEEETEYKVEFQTNVTETIPYNVTYIDDETLPIGKEVVEQKGANGCKSVTYKILYLNGAVVSKKVLSTDTYNAMERVIRRGVATKTTEPVQQPAEELTTTPVPDPTPDTTTSGTNTTTENTVTTTE